MRRRRPLSAGGEDNRVGGAGGRILMQISSRNGQARRPCRTPSRSTARTRPGVAPALGVPVGPSAVNVGALWEEKRCKICFHVAPTPMAATAIKNR